MKRFVVPLLALFALSIPFIAEAQINSVTEEWGWHPFVMRHTNAVSGTTVQEKNWAKGGHGGSIVVGFADTTNGVFNRGLPETRCDTTAAYRTEDFLFPPSMQFEATTGRSPVRGGSTTLAATDSVVVDSVRGQPWIVVRVRQDTLSYGYTGSSAMDSIYIAAQISYDGINWTSVSGTPTRAFSSVLITSGEDGLQPPALAAAENAPGTDATQLELQCIPEVYTVGNSFILNRTLCMAGAYVRFLINVADGVGQWKAEYACWSASTKLTGTQN